MSNRFSSAAALLVAENAPPAASKFRRYALVALVAVLALGAAVAGWLRTAAKEPQPLVRLNLALGPDLATAGFGAGLFSG